MVAKRAYLLLLALLPAACDWHSDGMERLESLYPLPEVVAEDIVIPEITLADVSTKSLSGRWVMEMKLPGTMNILGLVRDLLITNHFVVDLDVDSGQATLTFCQQLVDLDAGGLGATEMPAKTRDAIGQTPVLLAVDDSGIPAGQVAWTWGLQMDDPFTDPLPTTAEDPAVWDQDDDGNPGITMHVLSPEGDRYMVRRAVWDLAAAAAEEGSQWLEGTLQFTIDEGAVGVNGPDTLLTVIPIDPSPDGGTYRLRKVGSPEDDGWTCTELREKHLAIFADDGE